MATGNFSKSIMEASDEIYDLCTPCAENSEPKEAQKFCKDCEEYLCDECLQQHNKFSKMRSHVVIDMSEQVCNSQDQLAGAKEEILKCVVHQGNDLVKFCKNHDEVCCQICIDLNHRSCSNPIDISQAATDIKSSDEYRKQVSAVEKVHSSLKEERVKRQGNLTRLEMEKTNILNDIRVYQDDLHAKINDIANKSNQMIGQKYEDTKSTAKSKVLKLNSAIISSTQALQNMVTKNDVVAFVYMKTRMQDIQECQTILEDVRNQTDRTSSALTVKKDILQTLNEHETLLTEDIEKTVTPEVSEKSIMADNDVQKWSLFEEDEVIKLHVLKFGLTNIKVVLRKNLDEWKEKTLNIAVTGISGKGKSSLINTLRNIKASDEGAAPVGENECTTRCMPYPHPQYHMFVFWDVPGVGTTGFPEETYLKQIEVDRYDFFLIVLSDRVLKSDSWLAQEIQRLNKRFYFVRTKIDQDMNNIKLRQEDKFEEKKEFENLKNATRDLLVKDLGNSLFSFFMISNHHPNKYEFPDLLYQLLTDIPKSKKLDMVFGIAGMSKKIIEEKASALGSRIWKCALLSGAVAAIPIPHLSGKIDMAILLEEVDFYRKQLALDDDSLGKLAKLADMSLEGLKSVVRLKTPEDICTNEGIAKYIKKSVSRDVQPERVHVYKVPAIEIAIACGMSFASTMEVLERILNMMKEDAIDVLYFVTGKETAV